MGRNKKKNNFSTVLNCKECEFSTTALHSLQSHFKDKGHKLFEISGDVEDCQENERPFVCLVEGCDFRAKNEDGRNQHRNSKHRKCPKCGLWMNAGFKFEEEYNYHERHHIIHPEFDGNLCQEDCGFHLKLVHYTKNVRRRFCEYCEEEFETRGLLKDHWREKHSKAPKHICQNCLKKLPNMTQFRLHRVYSSCANERILSRYDDEDDDQESDDESQSLEHENNENVAVKKEENQKDAADSIKMGEETKSVAVMDSTNLANENQLPLNEEVKKEIKTETECPLVLESSDPPQMK